MANLRGWFTGKKRLVNLVVKYRGEIMHLHSEVHGLQRELAEFKRCRCDD